MATKKVGYRWVTTRDDDEELALLTKHMSNMSNDELALLQEMLDELERGRDGLLRAVSASIWDEQPVTMEQFLDDPYYLGEYGKKLYPALRERVCFIATSPDIREVILSGSTGYGKSTVASILAAYLLYKLQCLHDPAESLGLASGSELFFAVLSRNLHLAKTVMWAAIEEKIKLSPWFMERGFKKEGKDGTIIAFTKGVKVQLGSPFSAKILGLTVIAGIMDEANFMTQNKKVNKVGSGKSLASFDRAESTYSTLVRRIQSRFVRSGGLISGHMILVSSSTIHGSFTERRIHEGKDDPGVVVLDYATWEVKPDRFYSGEKFWLIVRADAGRPSITKTRVTDETRALVESQGGYVLEVPIEHWKVFEDNIDEAIRDMAGLATNAIAPYITRTDMIEKAMTLSTPHPFSSVEWTCGSVGDFVWDGFAVHRKIKLPGGFEELRWKPVVNPGSPRWVHLDPSLVGDSLGIAMGHISSWVDVVRLDNELNEYVELAPKIHIDFMLRVNPPNGEEIFLPDVRALIYALDAHGFNIVGVSSDSYQSADTLQQMKARGKKAELISVDSSTTPYDRLKSALYEGRLVTYPYAPLKEELTWLEFDANRRRVDHPPGKSKDVSDAVAGVVQGLIEYAKHIPIRGALPKATDREESDIEWITGQANPPPAAGQEPAQKPKRPMPFLF